MKLKLIILASIVHVRRYYRLILLLALITSIVTYLVFRSAENDIFVLDNNLIKRTVSKQARSNLKLPVHPSLYSFGRIIIHHPGQFPHGGPGALNYLHCALVTARFNSFMHIPSPASIPTDCSRYIDATFNVSSHDIVIIPEGAYFEKVPAWRSFGGRIVVYMLGMNAPLVEQYHTNVIWAPSSTYTRDLYLATGKQVLFSPIERFIYEVHTRDLENFKVSGNKSNIYKHLKMKENLIVIDNDSNFPPSLQAALAQLPLQPPVTFRVLGSMPFNHIPSWLQRAKVVVDLGVAGVERVNNEGALFDAIILVANSLNGMDPIDFPIPYEFKLDTRNETQMFEIIKNCLINYEILLPQWHALKNLTLDLPRRFLHDDIPSYFSTRSVKFFLISSSFEEESAIIPFALHCAVHHPLARIEAQVQNLLQFSRNHDMMLKLLKDLTNLSPDWLLLTERTLNKQPTFNNDSQYTIAIDPRNMIVDEQLPHILVDLLENKISLTLSSSCFGSVAQVAGDVTIWKSNASNNTTPSYVLNKAKKYKFLLEEQLINVYAKRTKQNYTKDIRLVSALYATQQHKLLQSMLPLAVPRFVTVMKDFEAIYPKNSLSD